MLKIVVACQPVFASVSRAALLRLCCWLLAACYFVVAQASSAEQTYAAKLNRQELALLAQLACGAPYGVGVASIDAQAFEKNAPANFAEVKCRPHAYLQQAVQQAQQPQLQPLYYVTQCAREGKQWSCNPAELETRLSLKSQSLKSQTQTRELLVRPSAVAPQVALDALRKISGYGYFQGQSIDTALQSTCHIGLGEKPDLLEISCARWSLTVSFWCPATPHQTACPRIILMAQHAE
jgi:hypothetical protein